MASGALCDFPIYRFTCHVWIDSEAAAFEARTSVDEIPFAIDWMHNTAVHAGQLRPSHLIYRLKPFCRIGLLIGLPTLTVDKTLSAAWPIDSRSGLEKLIHKEPLLKIESADDQRSPLEQIEQTSAHAKIIMNRLEGILQITMKRDDISYPSF